MSRFEIPTRDEAPSESQPILDEISKRFGFVPSLPRLMSLSPAVLSGVVGLQGALSKALDPETRTAIAIAVSQVNKCNYCLKAHCYVALKNNTSPGNDILLRESYDAQKLAAAEFAATVVVLRGHVADEDLKAIRGAGFTDAQILEIIALSVQFLMTNFMNNVALTDIDVELDQI
jgi:uncharacterized peroxidase-related enzyme